MTRTRTTRALGALSITIVLSLTAAGCSDDNPASSSSSSTSTHNVADVAFATGMIPHHAQALTMVDMTDGRTLTPEVSELVSDIREAQTPEITTMTGWLDDWHEAMPEKGSTTMEGKGGMGSSMPGMMTPDDLSSLDKAPDATFQTRWLRMMIQHHQGAVAMAETEIQDGEYAPAVDLARSIVASQSKEISTMRRLSSPG